MEWTQHLYDAIRLLRNEEDSLDKILKEGSQSEFEINKELRRIGRITEGLVDLLDLLHEKGDITIADQKTIKNEIGWIQADSIAMTLGNYPIPHLALEQ